MKPTLKLFLKPEHKINSLVWSLNYGICMFDYFMNPSDDKLRSNVINGYSIKHDGKKTTITYKVGNNGGFQSGSEWYFRTKKELKDFLKKKAIERYRFGTGTKPRINLFELTKEEKILLNIA